MMLQTWDKPVRIKSPAGGNRDVDGPFSALVVLLDEWPNMQSKSFMMARSQCRAAVSGRLPPDQARDVFVEAALEANLLH